MGDEREEAVGDRDGEVDEEAEEVAARDPKVARKPAAPTKAMILAHEVHHADYREWCPHCVAGKGVSHRHVTGSREDGPEAEFSMDYAFMTNDGQLVRADELSLEEVGKASPVIVGFDKRSESIWAMAVESKGVI